MSDDSAATTTTGSQLDTRPLIAEAIGTMVLVIVGPGAAIIASDQFGPLGVALAFGLALMAMAYSIGHISGCHINPAVTLGFYLMKKIDAATAGMYVAAQAVGALVGGLLLYIITEGGDPALDKTGVMAANGWGDWIGFQYGLGSVALVEVLFTALLVFVVLSTVSKGYTAAAGGLSVGFTLTMIHLATIPVDNTSVNPARSLGVAFFSGSDAVAQLWAFIVFPLVGAVVGFGAWKLIHEPADD